MNDTQTATEYNAVPHDPAMAAPDPAMFAPMTSGENGILRAHLGSGWYKQAAVYPVCPSRGGKPARFSMTFTGRGGPADRPSMASRKPGGRGMSPGDAWDAYVTAQQAAHEAVTECAREPGGRDARRGPGRVPARLRGSGVVGVRGHGAGRAGGGRMSEERQPQPGAGPAAQGTGPGEPRPGPGPRRGTRPGGDPEPGAGVAAGGAAGVPRPADRLAAPGGLPDLAAGVVRR